MTPSVAVSPAKPGLSQRIERQLARALLRLPDPLLRRLAGPPIVRDGQTLDTQVQFLLRLRKRSGKKPWHLRTLAQARRDVEIESGVLAPAPVRPVTAQGITLRLAERALAARLYLPEGVETNAPALMFLHGGGFALGSLDSHDGPCRWLADAARCAVVSIDYRLAPQQPFPAAVEDCVAAFRALVEQAAVHGIDARRIAVGGDSAGGNLAAVVAQQTVGDAIRPCFQLLFYPTVDMTSSCASIQTLAAGFFLENASIQWCKAHYLGGRDLDRDPRASPLFGDLAGLASVLPPALIQTAGFDPLRDEGEAYAAALAKAGVPVLLTRYASLIHGYINMAGGVRAAMPALEAAASALREAFAKI